MQPAFDHHYNIANRMFSFSQLKGLPIEMYFLNNGDICPKHFISTGEKLFSLRKGLKWSKKTVCRSQYFITLKDNCLVWNVIGWSDERSITWLRLSTLDWEEQESTLSKGTAEERKRRSVVTLLIVTVFLGVLIPNFVN